MGGRGLAELLGHPLVLAMIAAAFSAYAGYLTGQATMRSEIASLRDRVVRVEAVQARRNDFVGCSTRILDRLTDKTGIAPPCQIGGQ